MPISLWISYRHVYDVPRVWPRMERWAPAETANITEDTDSSLVKDANGNVLQDGDTVVLIKDLPVKGAPKPIKAGTKVKNIKLTSGDHNIDCKIDGFGAMALKSIFVRKG